MCEFKTAANDATVLSKFSASAALAAGKIIEVVSGQDYEDYITDHILKPLLMASDIMMLPVGFHLSKEEREAS